MLAPCAASRSAAWRAVLTPRPTYRTSAMSTLSQACRDATQTCTNTNKRRRAAAPYSASVTLMCERSRRGLLTTAAALAGAYCIGTAAASASCDGSTTATSSTTTDGRIGIPSTPAPVQLPPLFTSVQASKGHRSYMEDDWFLSTDGRFAAVYDGHGGASVSKYLRQNLYAQVQARLPEDKDSCDEETIMDALREAFKKVDEEVLKVRHWNYQGSTAVAVVIHHCPKESKTSIITANVGDSRAVLSRRGKAVDLTQDHKPNSAAELNRVERLGGNVRWINGNLAVSRAIGDRSERPYVSGECEIRSIPFDAEGDHFIIIATDGLWDVMTSDEAVQYVQAVMGGAMGALREGDSRGESQISYNTSSSSASSSTSGIYDRDRPVDMKLSDWTQKACMIINCNTFENAVALYIHPYNRYADDRGMIRAAMMSRKKKMARYLTQEAIRRDSSTGPQRC
eukprot:13593-Heterococcus_DN1.PRE.3